MIVSSRGWREGKKTTFRPLGFLRSDLRKPSGRNVVFFPSLHPLLDTIIRQLLIPSHVEESLQSLQTSVSAAEQWASSWNGRFGHAKTAILAVGQLAKDSMQLRQDPPPPPLEAILVIFGRRALIFFCLKALGKKWKITPLLCACAVVITLETQKCRKRAPHSVEFNFFINCDRHKRFSQNERRRVDLQKLPQIF